MYFPALSDQALVGTGKSTFSQIIRKRYEGVMAVVAPTGVAALNAGGVTIHSFFRVPPRIINPDDLKEVVPFAGGSLGCGDHSRLEMAFRLECLLDF